MDPTQDEPQKPDLAPAERHEQLGLKILALFEVCAVLFGAFLLTVLLTIPFLIGHVDTWLALPLEAATTEPRPAEEVRLELEGMEIAESVRLTEDSSGTELVLAGVGSIAEATSAAASLLEESGYRRAGFETRSGMDLARMLEGSGRIVFTIQALVFIVIGALLIWLRVRPGRLGVGPAPVSRTVLWGVGGGVVAFVGSAALGLLLEWTGLPVDEQEWVKELFKSRAAVWSIAPWIVLIVPFSEELFFRGYALRFLSQRIGPRAGLILSSGLFAVIHFNLSGFFVYFFIGVVLALIYRRTGRFAAPALGHMIHNGLVLWVSMVTTGL